MTTEKEKRKLAAVLHADVKDYSRLMEDDEEATVQTLSEYRELLLKHMPIHDGRLVDTAGDGFLMEFPSAVESVRFAVEFQHEIKDRNAKLPESRRLQFRIGITVGDVIQRGDSIFGDGVNIAARLESMAKPGGICISGTAYDQVKKKLGLDYQEIRHPSMKNISGEVRVYRVQVDGSEAASKLCSWDDVPHKRKRLYRNVAFIAVIIVIVIVGAKVISNRFSPPVKQGSAVRVSGLELPDRPSIAVLPFTNMSGDPKQDYFSDGITEEIITGLAKVPRLFVIARNSTFTYKGKAVNVQQVAQELGVQYVLEGSVRKAESKVRITAQLIDANTGSHLWAERYDRDFNIKDILALQDEITRKIVLAMQVKLTDGEQIRLWEKKAGPTNPEAYDKVLRATEYVYQCTQNGNAQARILYEEALELDPNYAKPYVGIAWTYISDAWFGWSSAPKQDLEKAKKNAEKAMSLNDMVDYTHFTFGLIYLLNREYDKAIKAARKAVELSPNGAEAHAWLGAILHFTGNDEEAGIILRRAIRLNPIPRSYYYEFLGYVDTALGNYNQAIGSLNKGLKRNPKNVGLYLCLASAYSLKGRTGKARKIVEHIKNIEPNLSLARIEGVLMYRDPAVTRKFVEALKKAGLN